MIKHIVMWKVKDDNKIENLDLMAEKLRSLKEKIVVIKSLEVGISYDLYDKEFEIVLVSSFDDKNDLEIYQKHPEHIKVGEFIKSVVSERAVVDYEV